MAAFNSDHERPAVQSAEIKDRAPPHPRWHPTPEGMAGARGILERHLEKALCKMALPLKPAEFSRARLLLRCTANFGDMNDDGVVDVLATTDFWFSVCAGNAQAGAVPFRALCVQLEEVDTVEDAEGHPFIVARCSFSGPPVRNNPRHACPIN